MIDRFEKFSFAMFNIKRCWNKIASEEMKKYDLKGSYAIYISAMHSHQGDMTASRLADLCGKDKADVSRAISIMEKKGLIRREKTGDSGYRAHLVLTENGIEAAMQISRTAVAAVGAAGNGISPEDRKVFYDTLEIISNNMKKICADGLPPEADPKG